MTALRHDGLYQSSNQFDRLDLSWYWFYLWFGPSGDAVMMAHNGPAGEAAARLRNGEQGCGGWYRVDGAAVTGRIEGYSVTFEGTLTEAGIELRADDGIGFVPREDTFRFVPAAVPTQ